MPSRLSAKVKLGFGVGDLGGNLFFTIMGFYLLFYLTDVVHLPAALAGTALMIGKIWDAVTDPAVGYLSDHTHTRWGRRRPYIFAGAILLFISMVVVFTDPGIASNALLFGYMTVMYCVLNTAYTLVNIPYGALTPELTEDFNERTLLNGYRMTFAVAGTFVGASVVLPLVGLAPGAAGWTLMGAVTGAVMLVSSLITFYTVKEGQTHPVYKSDNIFRSYRSALRMKPFLTALFPWALHITGVNIIQAALLYYFRNIYGNEGGFQIALPILLGSAIIFIPIWVRISRAIGKRASYNIGMSIVAVSVIVFFFFGHILGMTFAFVVMFVAGIGISTNYVMPFSIVPDVVEYDYAEHGVRREGVFYGMWTFVSKIGQAVGIAASGWILSIFGYQAPLASGVLPQQTELAKLGIRILTGPLPALFFIAGILILRHYPITAQTYEQIQEKIRARGLSQPAQGNEL